MRHLFGLPLMVLALIAMLLAPTPAAALQSDSFTSPALTARLITAENGVRPDARTLSAGLSLTLLDGWKTYWTSPGEVGLPPEIDWSGSSNLEAAAFQWPAPTRFRAFGIENFGYEEAVTHPILLTLKEAGQPASLVARVSLLVCSDICVPLDFELTLDIPAASGINHDAAAEIAAWSARVPVNGADAGMDLRATALAADGTALIVEIASAAPWGNPDVFPDFGPYAAFGLPDIRISADRTTLWAELPVLSLSEMDEGASLTITDGSRAATFPTLSLDSTAPAPPFEVAQPTRGLATLGWIALLAFAGGLILNVMPCVLPVLSIKLSSALGLIDGPVSRIRNGFLMTALGTLAFMWALAALVLTLQGMGYAVGWGTQFQSPVFLSFLILLLGLFAANLFGLFEIPLPSGLATRLAGTGGAGYSGDFATGAFAAILATPCSAPLLGTAVAFALTGSALDIVIIFTAMGLGLALPYLIVAVYPRSVARLPKPGRWMLAVKIILGAMLAATVLWLLSVLAVVASPLLAALIAAGLALAVLLLLAGVAAARPGLGALALSLTLVGALALPFVIDTAPDAAPGPDRTAWVPFDRAEIARHVSRGDVVFLDITADWCLTCKANKTLVLDRAPVEDALASPEVVAMRADWTRPDPLIQAFLEANDRFGIPFNIVYGPSAPDGIALSEILTPGAVMTAIETAFGGPLTLANGRP